MFIVLVDCPTGLKFTTISFMIVTTCRYSIFLTSVVQDHHGITIVVTDQGPDLRIMTRIITGKSM